MILHYGLLEATDRIARERNLDWADLALELHYADQAHFIREFKELVRRTPAEYARILVKRGFARPRVRSGPADLTERYGRARLGARRIPSPGERACQSFRQPGAVPAREER